MAAAPGRVLSTHVPRDRARGGGACGAGAAATGSPMVRRPPVMPLHRHQGLNHAQDVVGARGDGAVIAARSTAGAGLSVRAGEDQPTGGKPRGP